MSAYLHSAVMLLLVVAVCGAIPQNSMPSSGTALESSQQVDCQIAKELPKTWQEFNGFKLRTSSPGASWYSQWRGTFDNASNDIGVDVEYSRAGSVNAGKILMINGRVLAVQGPIASPGYELDALQSAVLRFQLVSAILTLALPDGPASVQADQAIDHSDGKTAIELHTTGAEATFGAPWRVTGEAKRFPCGGIQYRLNFTWTSGGDAGKENQERTQTLEGELFLTDKARIDDSLSLEAWKVFGDWAESAKNPTATDSRPIRYKSVGDVRKKLKTNN